MDAFIQTLQSALGRNEAVIARSTPRIPAFSSAPSHANSSNDRAIARELAASLDRAVDLGHWEHADRIAHQAMRLANEHPLLAERIARLRASRNDFEAALAIIDSRPPQSQPASMRLLRAVCLMQAGRGHEAHADLLLWARRSSAPLQARLMLAVLEWECGHADDAADALQHTLKQIEDPAALAALMLMAAAQDRRHMAGIWAERLAKACITHPHRAYFETMLAANGFNRPKVRLAATPETIASLATELLAQEYVIPALAESQRLNGERETIVLLSSAIEQAIDELEDQAAACDAMAMLSEMLDDRDVAEAWRSRADRARTILTMRDDVLASIGRGGVSFAAQSNDYLREKAA